MQISTRQGSPTCHLTHWHGFGVFSITIQVLLVKIAGEKDKKHFEPVLGHQYGPNAASVFLILISFMYLCNLSNIFLTFI